MSKSSSLWLFVSALEIYVVSPSKIKENMHLWAVLCKGRKPDQWDYALAKSGKFMCHTILCVNNLIVLHLLNITLLDKFIVLYSQTRSIQHNFFPGVKLASYTFTCGIFKQISINGYLILRTINSYVRFHKSSMSDWKTNDIR